MLRPFLLSLVVFGAGASSVSEELRPADVATWRWQVSAILDSQRTSLDTSPIANAVVGDYDQHYQRYERAGLPAPAIATPGR
jgi:hypothetical protein